MAHQTLEHTGPAIVEEYYPKYADDVNRIYPLYSMEVYLGSALMLIGMGALGLPITALAYQLENGDVTMTTTLLALLVFVLFEVVGLAIIVLGFKKHKRPHEDLGRADQHQ